VANSSSFTSEPLLILSLETATRDGSLALMRSTALLDSVKGVADESHSVNLLQQIESLLERNQVTLRDVDLFATATGPGSFTGLRIGLATIKGFAHSLGRTAIGIPTLSAVAHSAGRSPKTCALLQAGRGEVFAQMFSVDEDGEVSELSNAEHLPPAEVLRRMAAVAPLRWAGPGARIYAQAIEERARELGINFQKRASHASSPGDEANDADSWTLVDDDPVLAEHVALLAWREVQETDTARYAEDLHAIYVRPSDAELNKNVSS
jgi:tRNA threonylcarbamoyladenosine biosynthesis protein TsaB